MRIERLCSTKKTQFEVGRTQENVFASWRISVVNVQGRFVFRDQSIQMVLRNLPPLSSEFSRTRMNCGSRYSTTVNPEAS